jgi:hypothetical protein
MALNKWRMISVPGRGAAASRPSDHHAENDTADQTEDNLGAAASREGHNAHCGQQTEAQVR